MIDRPRCDRHDWPPNGGDAEVAKLMGLEVPKTCPHCAEDEKLLEEAIALVVRAIEEDSPLQIHFALRDLVREIRRS